MTRDIQQLKAEWKSYQTNPPRYGKVWSDRDMGLAMDEIDRLRAENGSIWDHLQRASRSLDNAVKVKDRAVFERTQLFDQFNALQIEFAHLVERFNSLQAERDKLQAENESLKDDLDRCRVGCDHLGHSRDHAVSERTKLLDRFNALQAEFAAYRERGCDQKESLTRKALRDLIESVMSDD